MTFWHSHTVKFWNYENFNTLFLLIIFFVEIKFIYFEMTKVIWKRACTEWDKRSRNIMFKTLKCTFHCRSHDDLYRAVKELHKAFQNFLRISRVESINNHLFVPGCCSLLLNKLQNIMLKFLCRTLLCWNFKTVSIKFMSRISISNTFFFEQCLSNKFSTNISLSFVFLSNFFFRKIFLLFLNFLRWNFFARNF